MKIVCKKCGNRIIIKVDGTMVSENGKKFCEHCDDIAYQLKPNNQRQFDFKTNKK